MLTILAAELATLPPESRLALRQRSRRWYESLKVTQNEFAMVLRRAATARRAVDLHRERVPEYRRLRVDGGAGTLLPHVLDRINFELVQARDEFADNLRFPLRPNAKPSAMSGQVIVHHLVNVYGRRTDGGVRPLTALEHVVNDFHAAGLSKADI